MAHQIGSKLWKKKLAEMDAEFTEYQKTPEAIEIKRREKKEIEELLDKLLSNPEFPS